MISVIVPVYNSEKCLFKCIQSILEQSYQNFEIILINDCSTDNSGTICDLYASKDKRVVVIHQEHNCGPAIARNTGIKKSKGEFIFFIDSDDSIEKDSLRLLIANYEKYKSDMIVGDFYKIGDTTQPSGNKGYFSSNTTLTKEEIMDYTKYYLKAPNRYPLLTQSWGRLFRSDIIKENKLFFDSKLRTFEDVAFNFMYLKYANSLSFVNKPLYNLTIHNDYLSATMKMVENPESLFGYRSALQKVRDFLKTSQFNRAFDNHIQQAYIRYTIIQLIRLCIQIDHSNKKQIYTFIHDLVHDSNLQNSLNFYFPHTGESRLIPLLMKYKLVSLLMIACKHRGSKRYSTRLQLAT